MSIEQEQTKTIARDQPVGKKPEGTSDSDFKEFERRRRSERSQIDVDEGRRAGK